MFKQWIIKAIVFFIKCYKEAKGQIGLEQLYYNKRAEELGKMMEEENKKEIEEMIEAKEKGGFITAGFGTCRKCFSPNVQTIFGLCSTCWKEGKK